MKDWMDPNMRRNTVYSVVTVCVSVLICMFLFKAESVTAAIGAIFSVLGPLVWGFVLAYLLSGPMMRVEKGIGKLCERKKPHPTLKRTLSIIVVYAVLLLILCAVVSEVLPDLLKSVVNLVDVLPEYARYLAKQITSLLSEHDIDPTRLSEMLGTGESWISNLTDYIKPIVTNLVNFSVSVTGVLSNFFIGLIASVYMLAGKEKFCRQIKKVLYALCSTKRADSIVHWTREGHRTFGGFIGGKILDSAIVGVVCYLFMLVTNMPYALLMSSIVGVTNLVPFFGPIVGGVIASLIMVLVSPSHALWFILFCIVLQQIDGNLLGPAILGDSLGLSPFWVMASIIVGGKLFGFAGMLVGIPLCALIYAMVRTLCNERLAAKDLPVNSDDFADFPPQENDLRSTVKPGYIDRLKKHFSKKKS